MTTAMYILGGVGALIFLLLLVLSCLPSSSVRRLLKRFGNGDRWAAHSQSGS